MSNKELFLTVITGPLNILAILLLILAMTVGFTWLSVVLLVVNVICAFWTIPRFLKWFNS